MHSPVLVADIGHRHAIFTEHTARAIAHLLRAGCYAAASPKPGEPVRTARLPRLSGPEITMESSFTADEPVDALQELS